MKITFDVPEATVETLRMVLARCTTDQSTHGALTLESMFEMLAEDVALTELRPGSWEGANMATVFQSHGYSI